MKNKTVEIRNWGKWKIAWAAKKHLKHCQHLIENGEIDGIGLSQFSGSDIFDLSVLEEIVGLKGLILPHAEKFNLDALPNFTLLQLLVIAGTTSPVDLSNFNSLVDLSIDWNKKIILPISVDSLRSLRIDKLGTENLSIVSRYEKLTFLELVQGKITSLDGIELLSSIEKINLHYMSKLTSLEAIAKTPVKEIFIDKCPKITNLECVSNCQNLVNLGYHSSADLQSIHFINKCKKLESFRFVDVDVLDGDMTPLMQLKDFAFTNKKHFSHTEKSIRK